MRLDDDSFLRSSIETDFFQDMVDKKLKYVYRSYAYDPAGIDVLGQVVNQVLCYILKNLNINYLSLLKHIVKK